MAPHVKFGAGVTATYSVSLFTPKRQSPTEHLQALRRPNAAVSNSSSYLSPGLHNVPDIWVRFLRSKAHQFVDEFGEGKNQRLLMGKSVQERKAIQQWCNNVKSNARTFILGIHDDEVAAKKEEYLEYLSEQARLAAIEDWSAPIEDWSAEYEEEEDEKVACAVEDWSADVEESDEQVSCAIEDWSADFEDSNEQVEFAFQLKVDKDVNATSATLSPSSSCSSLSTEYDPIFDSDENSSDDDEDMNSYTCPSNAYPSNAYPSNDYPSNTYPSNSYPSNAYPSNDYPSNGYSSNGYSSNPCPNNGYSSQDYTSYSYPGHPMEHSECDDSLKGPFMNDQDTLFASATDIDLEKKEDMGEEKISSTESLLASAWQHSEGHGHQLTTCSWLPIKSQATHGTNKAASNVPPVPHIKLTTPEGQACDLIERQTSLPLDFNEYAEERAAAQPSMEEKLRKWRALHETYSQYCKRLDEEKLLKARQEETARNMAVEAQKTNYL